MIPAFNFISQKLAESGLQITLLISEQAPFVIPVWPMSRKSQWTLTKIVRKARSKFKCGPSWMNTVAALEKTDLPRVFDLYRPDSYIVRRSLLQQEIVFAADGFTLLSMDHIFTLKQFLCGLSKKDSISYARDLCLSSCVSLLRRIQTIHDGTPFTKGYMERVYLEVPFQEAIFDQVVEEYEKTFCTANIRDIASGLDFLGFYDHEIKRSAEMTEMVSPAVELPDTAIPHEIVSPVSGENLNHFPPWLHAPVPESERLSNITVNLPWVQKPSASPVSAQEAQIWHRSESTTPTSREESWGPYAPPSPLRIAKRDTTQLVAQEAFEVRSVEPSCQTSGAVQVDSTEQSSQYSEQANSNDMNRLSFRGLKELEAEMYQAEQQETTRLIVEAWSKGVEKGVCARCFDVICTDGVQPAKRVTYCY